MSKFIDITQVTVRHAWEAHDGSAQLAAPELPRSSTLQYDNNGLVVLGNLPHGYKFAPKTIHDTYKLMSWLAIYALKQEFEGKDIEKVMQNRDALRGLI